MSAQDLIKWKKTVRSRWQSSRTKLRWCIEPCRRSVDRDIDSTKKARRSSPSAYFWFQKPSVQAKSATRRGRISLPFAVYIYINVYICICIYAYVQSESEHLCAPVCRKSAERSTRTSTTILRESRKSFGRSHTRFRRENLFIFHTKRIDATWPNENRSIIANERRLR